jgi:hypothetical protein
MKRGTTFVLVFLLLSAAAYGQGVIGDVLMGKLVKPKAGVWAWYDLVDTTSGRGFVVRLAIVGEEKVGVKDGYWLEVQIVPIVGYESVVKILVTGPAGDPANIHKMLRRDGAKKAEEVPIEKEAKGGAKDQPKEPERALVAEEDVQTLRGAVHAEHYELKQADKKIDVWLNDQVAPMGVVQMKSSEGALRLRNYGAGGSDARSIINEPPVKGVGEADSNLKVDVHVEKEPKRVPPKEQPKGAAP